jgi:hypothetical protein
MGGFAVKRLLAASFLAVLLAAPVVVVAAPAPEPRVDCEYDDSQSHPLRIAAYAVHPVGVALKYLVAWPIHWVVSRPSLEGVFGHTPHEDYAFDEDYL